MTYKEEKCEDCGITSEDLNDDDMLVYDEDGCLLCTDCLFEQESMKDFDEDDEDDWEEDEDDTED